MYPILFHSPFVLHSYPFFMGLAWGLAYFGGESLVRQGRISKKGFHTLFWGTFLCAWLGAKVLFLLTYPGLRGLDTFEVVRATSFWFGGGLVFYGGLLGALFFIFSSSFFLKLYKLSDLTPFLPLLCFAHGIGRLGCLMAGCCFGKVCTHPLAFAINGQLRHPSQLYEALGLFILGFFLRKKDKEGEGPLLLLSRYLMGYGTLRFFIESTRGDQARGLWAIGLTPSQWISGVLGILGILIWMKFRSENKRFLKEE